MPDRLPDAERAEARANGPEAVAELKATLRRLRRCVFCRAPIPSLKRQVCPPCKAKGLGRG